jgi:hypothetical protein
MDDNYDLWTLYKKKWFKNVILVQIHVLRDNIYSNWLFFNRNIWHTCSYSCFEKTSPWAGFELTKGERVWIFTGNISSWTFKSNLWQACILLSTHNVTLLLFPGRRTIVFQLQALCHTHNVLWVIKPFENNLLSRSILSIFICYCWFC